MMGKRGAGHLEGALYVVDALALQAGADQQPKNPQSIFLSESTKLFNASIHYYISSIIEINLTQAPVK